MAEELKFQLLETNQEFRELASKHHSLDDRLHELETKQYLSDDEQFEEISLKKRKLHIKDRMESILREHRSGSHSSTTSSAGTSRASA